MPLRMSVDVVSEGTFAGAVEAASALQHLSAWLDEHGWQVRNATMADYSTAPAQYIDLSKPPSETDP